MQSGLVWNCEIGEREICRMQFSNARNNYADTHPNCQQQIRSCLTWPYQFRTFGPFLEYSLPQVSEGKKYKVKTNLSYL
jgi:hypothetical protein